MSPSLPEIAAVMTGWSHVKDVIEAAVPIDNLMLHVIVGYALYALVVRLVRGPRAPLTAWLVVLAAILANEFVDLWIEQWPDPAQQYGESLRDLLWTMALPSVALFLARPLPAPSGTSD